MEPYMDCTQTPTIAAEEPPLILGSFAAHICIGERAGRVGIPWYHDVTNNNTNSKIRTRVFTVFRQRVTLQKPSAFAVNFSHHPTTIKLVLNNISS